MPLPAEVVMYRNDPAEPYRIGVSPGSEHALGWLRPDVGVRRRAPGDWVFLDPDTGEELPDTLDLERGHWQQVLADYPLPLIRTLLPNSIRNAIWSQLVFRLVLRGVREPTTWELRADQHGLTLQDADGNLRAELEADDWWWGTSDEWIQAAAEELVNLTGLEPMTTDELMARFGDDGPR